MSAPISVVVAALGGQGGGVLAEWLFVAATRAGHVAQSTSIPGVAQRTGATTYYIEVFPDPADRLDGRMPVLGLYPVPGRVDLIVSSELLEAVRAVQSGLASPTRTTLITSSSRTLTNHEKIILGDGRLDSAALIEVARANSRRFIAFDMDASTREAGTVVSAVMAGAIAASGVLPFDPALLEATIRESGQGAHASLRGFALGYAAAGGTTPATTPAPMLPAKGSPTAALGAAAAAHPTLTDFPAAVRDMIEAGFMRLAAYQDRRYAELYLRRLEPILTAERKADPSAVHEFALTRETARYLALWMAFDDIVRVAWLKCRASRFARVRREVAAREGDLVRITDYFKPGIPEIAGLLPPALAKRLIAWDVRRQAGGHAPFSLALRLRSDSIHGFLALRALAAMRGLRRRGLRYGEEQAAIERWLTAVAQATATDWRIGHEISLSGRLVKGYGETNERGKRNLFHIVETLARSGTFAAPRDRANAIRRAREAALADEGGKALDSVLAAHGASPRPTVVKPVVLVRRPHPRVRGGVG